MITLEQLRTEYKPQILALAVKYGVENIRIFGSVARGDANDKSDIDFLFTRLRGTDLMDLGGLHSGLEETLGKKVDIVSDTAISPYMRERILQEAVPL